MSTDRALLVCLARHAGRAGHCVHSLTYYFVLTYPFHSSSPPLSLTVYRTFAEQWKTQLDKDALRRSCSNADIRRKLPKPSLAIAFISAFGGPFFAAGGLKFIHDSLVRVFLMRYYLAACCVLCAVCCVLCAMCCVTPTH